MQQRGSVTNPINPISGVEKIRPKLQAYIKAALKIGFAAYLCRFWLGVKKVSRWKKKLAAGTYRSPLLQ
jgi:hypothetical protein